MAGNSEAIIRQCLRANEPIPPKIANAPTVPPELSLYWNAFLDLDTTRTHSNGPVPISILDMYEYCGHCGLDDFQCETLLYLVREMDNFHVKRIAAKLNAAMNKR